MFSRLVRICLVSVVLGAAGLIAAVPASANSLPLNSIVPSSQHSAAVSQPPSILPAGHILARGPNGEGMMVSPGYEALLYAGPAGLDLNQVVPKISLIAGTWGASARVTVPNNDRAFLAMQGDGNLVLYSQKHIVLWASNTQGTGAHNRLVLQDDGNLVIYTSSNKAVWSTGTTKVVISSTDKLGSGKWLVVKGYSAATLTKLTMQAGGNLVLTVGTHVVWATNTKVPGSYLTVQTNGNLVVRAPDGHGIWASGAQSSCKLCWFSLNQYGVSINGENGLYLWVRPYPAYFPTQ